MTGLKINIDTLATNFCIASVFIFFFNGYSEFHMSALSKKRRH